MSKVIMGHNLTLQLMDMYHPILCATQCQLQIDVDMLEIAPTSDGREREFLPVSSSYSITADGYLPEPMIGTEQGVNDYYFGHGDILQPTLPATPRLIDWTMQIYVPAHGSQPEGARVIQGKAYIKSQTITSPLQGPALSHIVLQGTQGLIMTDCAFTNFRYSIMECDMWSLTDEETGEDIFFDNASEVAHCGYRGQCACRNRSSSDAPGSFRFFYEYRLKIYIDAVPALMSSLTVPAFKRDDSLAGNGTIYLKPYGNTAVFYVDGAPTTRSLVASEDGSYYYVSNPPQGENITCYLIFSAATYMFYDHFTYSILPNE